RSPNTTAANRPMCMFVSRRWHKSATITRARSASMPCGRKHRNWVGASRRSAFSTGIWGGRGHRQRGGTTSKHWWRRSPWVRWARCWWEASRLARSHLDWHRLLPLCALTETLVIDEDGGYDPADFNDGLWLGLKGLWPRPNFIFCARASWV